MQTRAFECVALTCPLNILAGDSNGQAIDLNRHVAWQRHILGALVATLLVRTRNHTATNRALTPLQEL